MSIIDETHDAARTSWIDGAEAHADFPIQNLPLGIFSVADAAPSGGMAIGDMIVGLRALAESGLLDGEAKRAAVAASGGTLNALLALGAAPRRALRRSVSTLLSDPAHRAAVDRTVFHASDCTMHLPAAIGDYTDFYVGIHHATNVGRLFRPDQPLMPNYKHVPIGYHGRASSVRVSGHDIRRPRGQVRPAGEEQPRFQPSARLDHELELGLWIGPGNALGESIAIGDAESHIAGLCVLNDWSARDVQAWEYQPLGPFLSKSFHTTISPWIVTAEALAPFRRAQAIRPDGDPRPLPYLMDDDDQRRGAFSIQLEAFLSTAEMRRSGVPAHRLSRGSTDAMYWTAAQMVAHHSVGGCNLRPGDLLGTGTLSVGDEGGMGSLLEISAGGSRPLTLATGETRTFLQDGDEILLAARAVSEGAVTIGFGECRGRILPALGS